MSIKKESLPPWTSRGGGGEIVLLGEIWDKQIGVFLYTSETWYVEVHT